MKARKIIEAIKEYYFSMQNQGEEGESKPSSMSKLDMCAYYALLSSLNEAELEEAEKLTVAYEILDLWYIVSSFRNRKSYNTYSKNESIDTLLQRFTNRKSKRVVESRKELQTRFPYLSFSEQKKIVKAFLTSPAMSDRDWAAVEADKRWDKSYATALADAYTKKLSQKLAITVIRHMPIEFVKECERTLVLFSRVEFCIRLSSNLESLRSKYDISFFEYLYIAARSGIKINKSENGIETEFFRQVFEFCIKSITGINPTYYHIDDIPWIRRAVWALGELGCNDTILKLLEMKSYCLNEHFDNTEKTQLYFAHKWIINHYFPEADEFSGPPFEKIKIAVENYKHPRSIKVKTLEDLEKYDDIPPDTIKFLSDFI